MPTIGIIQPNFVPWRGYFDFIHEVDDFVFLDDVQYTARDWRNRNRIRQPDGRTIWLSVPVLADYGDRIDQVRTDPSQPWKRRHLNTLRHAYGRTPHFGRVIRLLEEVYARDLPLLADLDIALTEAICAELGIRTRLHRASAFGCAGVKDTRLIQLVQRLGGRRYLSGPAAKVYLDEAAWREAGIELAFKDYAGYPEYKQIAEPFDAAVSILDLLFMVGADAPDYMWGCHRQRG